MELWLLAIVLSIVITILLLLAEQSHPERNDKTTFGVKVFIISFITIYFGMLFLGPECVDVTHEISTGEPPF
jgi:hypothetical protein